MGNEVCCQVSVHQLEFQQPHNQLNFNSPQSTQNIHIPQLTQQTKDILNKLHPFQEQFETQQNIIIKKFGNDIYQGPLDAIGRPTKIGKMYKQNMAFFIGHFVSGKAQGPCVYIMKDGSYYEGQMRQNTAQSEKGKFVSGSLEYIGGFQNSRFNGQGTERLTSSDYVFIGIYQNGLKKSGLMKWTDNKKQFEYEGEFDENGQFYKKGKLTDTNGRYEGEFMNGMKNGYGVYYYNTKLRYEGYYVDDKKEGQGQLYNSDNTLAYRGVFKNGLPNGKGVGVTQQGHEFETQWNDGIDVRLL